MLVSYSPRKAWMLIQHRLRLSTKELFQKMSLPSEILRHCKLPREIYPKAQWGCSAFDQIKKSYLTSSPVLAYYNVKIPVISDLWCVMLWQWSCMITDGEASSLCIPHSYRHAFDIRLIYKKAKHMYLTDRLSRSPNTSAFQTSAKTDSF